MTDISSLIERAQKAAAHLREDADFNRSWTDGRRGGDFHPTAIYVARRIEVAEEREQWAEAIDALSRLTASPLPAPGAAAAAAVCHDEQLEIWAGEFLEHFGLAGFLHLPESYEEKIELADYVKTAIKDLVEKAFDHPELAASPLPEEIAGLLGRAEERVAYHDRVAATISNLGKPRTDNDAGRTAQLIDDLAAALQQQAQRAESYRYLASEIQTKWALKNAEQAREIERLAAECSIHRNAVGVQAARIRELEAERDRAVDDLIRALNQPEAGEGRE